MLIPHERLRVAVCVQVVFASGRHDGVEGHGDDPAHGRGGFSPEAITKNVTWDCQCLALIAVMVGREVVKVVVVAGWRTLTMPSLFFQGCGLCVRMCG